MYRQLRNLLDRTFKKVGFEKTWEKFLGRYAMSTRALKRIPRYESLIIQVVGTPRSGTTLLASMLDSHSQAVCLIEPFLAWLKKGQYEYQKEKLGLYTNNFGTHRPQKLLSFLCRQSKLKVVGFKETFRTPYHPTFPTQSFLTRNHSVGAVDQTLAIVRDPRDTWSSVVRRHPHFRNDTAVLAELIHAWNQLCDWIRGSEVSVVRYEDLVFQPESIGSLLDDFGLGIERNMFRPEGTKGYGDKRAQEGGTIDDRSVGKYSTTISCKLSRFISAQCHKNMQSFGYK